LTGAAAASHRAGVSDFEIELELVELPADAAAMGPLIDGMPIESRADVVRQGLARHNHTRAPMVWAPLNVFVRDAEGRVRGGLVGETWGTSLFVSQLWVESGLRGRGFGAGLLAAAEAEARRRGCDFAHLDTMTFQAPDFYRRLGWQVYGVLDGYPDGHQRFSLRKSLR
jgi:GNAT superfamily N-acetyltransferase